MKITEIIGLLGFLVSFVNLAIILRSRVIKMQVGEVVFSSWRKDLIIDFILSNMSGLPISIVRVDVVKWEYRVDDSGVETVDRIILEKAPWDMESTLNERDVKTGVITAVVTSPIPFSLAPYESRRIAAKLRGNDRLQQLLLSVPGSDSLSNQEKGHNGGTRQPSQGLDKQARGPRFSIALYTSRRKKPVFLDISPKYLPYTDWRKTAQGFS